MLNQSHKCEGCGYPAQPGSIFCAECNADYEACSEQEGATIVYGSAEFIAFEQEGWDLCSEEYRAAHEPVYRLEPDEVAQEDARRDHYASYYGFQGGC